MTRAKPWVAGGLGLLALAQMTAPAPVGARVVMAALCGDVAGRAVPIRLPGKGDAPPGAPCCKICHSAMRKRGAGNSCCDGEDPTDAT